MGLACKNALSLYFLVILKKMLNFLVIHQILMLICNKVVKCKEWASYLSHSGNQFGLHIFPTKEWASYLSHSGNQFDPCRKGGMDPYL